MRLLVLICAFLIGCAWATSAAGNSPPAGEIALDQAPVATTGAAQAGDWFAFLNGTVNPNGLETRAWFEWGLTPALGSATPPQIVSAGLEGPVSDEITGLESFTRYYFRLVAENASGQGVGETQTFGTLDTLPPPPSPCVVPRVVRLRLGRARTLIRRAGCSLGRVLQIRSWQAKGIVLSQHPRAGTKVRHGGLVRLVTSNGRNR